ALLLGRVERAETAAAGHLEDDLRALADLVERDALALVLRHEVLRVAVERLDARVGRLRAGLEARDVADHGRDRDAAHRADDVLRAVARGEALGLETGEVADLVADLVLGEDQTLEVLRDLRLREVRDRVHVDARELDLRELLGHLLDRLLLQEADPDHEVVAGLRERRQVRDVVGRAVGRVDLEPDVELLDGPLQPQIRKMVEAAVVQAADVGHETDLDGGGSLLRRRLGRVAGRDDTECQNGNPDRRQDDALLHMPSPTRTRLLPLSAASVRRDRKPKVARKGRLYGVVTRSRSPSPTSTRRGFDPSYPDIIPRRSSMSIRRPARV